MRILISVLIIGLSFISEKITAQNKTISVIVTNVTSDTGKMSYALFNKENFRKEPIKAKSSAIKNGISKIVFDEVPKGEYAIICFHDKNNNNKMDFEPSGMPMEDYGVSTNNLNRFGPPQYDQIKFMLNDKNVSLEIKL